MNYYVEFQQLGVGRFFQSHLKLDFCRENHDLPTINAQLGAAFMALCRTHVVEASTPRGPVDSLRSSPAFSAASAVQFSLTSAVSSMGFLPTMMIYYL